MEDFGNKRVVYAGWGGKEYFLFDPTGELSSAPLRGFRLESGEYMPMMGTRLHCEVLDLDLVVEKGRLRLYDSRSGTRLYTHEESEAARRLAEARVETAEAEVARLREELAKRREKKS